METLPQQMSHIEGSKQIFDDSLIEVGKRALIIGSAVGLSYWLVSSLLDEDEESSTDDTPNIKEAPTESSFLSNAISSFAVTTMLGLARNTLSRFLSATDSK